jgi:hypothetical protein
MNLINKESTNEDRPEKWTGGVDWYRYRTRQFSDTRTLLDAIRDLQQKDYEAAGKVQRWHFQGYSGWRSETIRYGERDGKLIWESSGSRAASTLDLSELCTGQASRIDLQATVCLSTPQPGFGTSLLESITRTSNLSRRTPIRLGQHTETSGLWLGTVGTRTHHSYLRVYDKGVESKLAPSGKMWRVELEAKHQHAAQLCLKHQQDLKDPSFCANYSVRYLQSLGSSWPFGKLGDTAPDVDVGRSPHSTPGKLASWLILSVRPAVHRLLNVFTVAEVLEMLDLSAVATPTGKDRAQSEPPALHDGRRV